MAREQSPIRPPLFHMAHYNIVAAQIRDNYLKYDIDTEDGMKLRITTWTVLTGLALDLAKRFRKDNPLFDPIKFLTKCSPDNDLYPIYELWEEV